MPAMPMPPSLFCAAAAAAAAADDEPIHDVKSEKLERCAAAGAGASAGVGLGGADAAPHTNQPANPRGSEQERWVSDDPC
jgi:hypothetical protein